MYSTQMLSTRFAISLEFRVFLVVLNRVKFECIITVSKYFWKHLDFWKKCTMFKKCLILSSKSAAEDFCKMFCVLYYKGKRNLKIF